MFDQNKLFSYAYILTTANPIYVIQSAVYWSQLVLIQISYSCQGCIWNLYILPYSYSLELGENIELFV